MNWIDYWDTDRIFNSVMRRMTGHFFETSRGLLDYGESDVVLDFGCGPGFLVERLEGVVKQVYGVDTSPRMIEECGDKFRDRPGLEFHLLPRDRYTDLSFLDGAVTKTVVLSVVQYFSTVEDVGDLIRSVASVSAPGARLLIADIPTDSAALRDTAELLRAGLKEGFLFQCLAFLARTRFSRYAGTRAQQGLLCLPVPVLERLIADLNLNAEILTDPLTYNHRRVHLLVRL
jgi:SAM-dependent methyltransferase